MKLPSFNILKYQITPPWQIDLQHHQLMIALSLGVLTELGFCYFAIKKLNHIFSILQVETIAQFILLSIILGFMYFLPKRGNLRAKLGISLMNAEDWRLVAKSLGVIYLFQILFTPLWQKILELSGIGFREEQRLLEICSSAEWKTAIMVFFLAAILIPVVEEVVFRRVLFAVLLPLGVVPAVVVGALIFALLHFFILGFWSLFVLGIIFQVIYLRSKNLSVNIAVHIIFNSISISAALLSGVK